MILDLCQHVQKYLHLHNKPPARSFYDEMITNKRLLEEQNARELEKKQQRQVQQIEEAIRQRHDALKEDARKRRELARMNGDSRHSSSDSATPTAEGAASLTPIPKDSQQFHFVTESAPCKHVSDLHGTWTGSAVSQKQKRKSYNSKELGFSDRRTSTPLLCDADDQDPGDGVQKTNIFTLNFNTKKERLVHIGKCLGHSPRGSTVFAGMDVSTGDLVAISEWVLKWKHINRKLNMDEREMDEKEANKYLKQVATVEKEMFGLLRLDHKHLLKYQAFKYIQDSGKITLYILMDYAGGGSLDLYIKRKEPVQPDLMRHYVHQILEALVYIHNKAVVHKDIRASSLLLDKDGNVRLADISLTKRLTDLVAEVNSKQPGVKFEEKVSPVIGGRGGKKSDIYRLGLVLLSLAKGELITETLPEIPKSLPEDLKDFLGRCLIRNELNRWSAQELCEHSFVKVPLYSQPQSTSSKKPIHSISDEDSGDSSGEQVIPFIPASGSGSRLQNEFEIIKWIGKGGFGDVIKVKNKLDRRFYAIKRIPLNPSKKSFTRKITREVKLLSMLNHENVVRYYNSWIETSTEPVSDNSLSTCTDLTSSVSVQSSAQNGDNCVQAPSKKAEKNVKADVLRNSLGLVDNIEDGFSAQVEGSVEWSVSFSITENKEDDSSDDDDNDEDDVFGASFLPHSDSDDDDGIIFEHNSNSEEGSESEIQKNDIMKREKSSVEDESNTSVPRIQFLYIQMEFCEKSTLRNCIDAGLYENIDRVWQLFREVVEGLVHIHEQGMIHRDLKPVNIFLDSNDHVKIGDFGLATTDILTKQQTTLIDLTLNPSLMAELSCSSSHSESADDMHNLTGKVGTALYVAPEMATTSKLVRYSQKVDIYSLGVMFFEMCYHPLPTGMERVKILSSLREPEVELPEDFDQDKLANQVLLLRLLLDHDPSKRPTASEILQSELLPPPQMEEAELNEVLRSTIANPNSKLYKRMIDAIFSQPVTPAMDFAYDNELYKMSNQFSQAQALISMYVADTMEKIFRKHGAIRVSSPILMPKCKLYDSNESYVCFMDHIGGLVALPYDLKVPFARFIARHGTSELKRYTIGNVYRENRVYGLHPKELVAASFDIVTPTSASLAPDAEVISVVFEIIAEFPVLESRNYFLRINHKLLFEGILLYCGVPKKLHQEVCAILGDSKNERQKKTQIQTRLYSLSLTEHTVDSLYHFVETEGPYGKISCMLKRITKTKGIASSLASKGLKEMEAIINHTESLGFKIQHVLALGLITNVRHHSGAMFQVVRNFRKKTKQMTEVLAAGGRYDNIVAEFQKPGSTASQCIVGISIAMERVITAVTEQKDFKIPPAQDVVVCSLGHQSFLKEKLSLTKSLWAIGISAVVLYEVSQSLDDVQEHCRKCGVTHIVIFKDSEGAGTVKMRWFDKDRILEKKVPVNEVPSYLQQKLQTSCGESTDQTQPTSLKASSSVSQLSEGSSNKDISGSSSVKHNFNITVINADSTSKTGKNARRNYESQIYSTVSPCLVNISTKSHIEIIAMDLTSQVLKTIVAYLDLSDDEKNFNNSISPIIERHPRHRKYLPKIFDHIAEVKFEKNIPVIVLYSLKDDSYKVLL